MPYFKFRLHRDDYELVREAAAILLQERVRIDYNGRQLYYGKLNGARSCAVGLKVQAEDNNCRTCPSLNSCKVSSFHSLSRLV